jgi:NADH-quinone oxidoreductase subunit B
VPGAPGGSSAVDLPLPTLGAPAAAPSAPLRLTLDWGHRYSLWCFDLGLACCAVEFVAAATARSDLQRAGVLPVGDGTGSAELLVVSGTLSDKMAPVVRRLYEQMPEPRYVLSFGACANSGGPYWDSYCVTKGVDQILPVDVYVPGCPPRPEALLAGVAKLSEKIAAESGQPHPGARSAASLTAPVVRP